MSILPDHPEIEMAMRTGYPSWNQPSDTECECCGAVIECELFGDENYEFLCLDCLIKLHAKGCV